LFVPTSGKEVLSTQATENLGESAKASVKFRTSPEEQETEQEEENEGCNNNIKKRRRF
jgi:hypothetical protein